MGIVLKLSLIIAQLVFFHLPIPDKLEHWEVIVRSGTLHTSIGKRADNMSFIKYISDENHYKEVLSFVGKAKQMVWIGTADIKDLYVKPVGHFLFPCDVEASQQFTARL